MECPRVALSLNSAPEQLGQPATRQIEFRTSHGSQLAAFIKHPDTKASSTGESTCTVLHNSSKSAMTLAIPRNIKPKPATPAGIDS